MKLFPVYEYLQHEHERALESKERDASLRLASDRQNLNVAWERYASMGEKIKLATREQDQLLSLMDEYNALGIDDESQWKVLQGKYDAETPVISRMRAELELPFDEAYYNQIIAENHKKQQEYLEAFIQEQAVQLEEDQIQA